MPTTKKRVSITLDPEIYERIKKIVDLENKPLSTKVLELFLIGLDLEEDQYLSLLSEKRLKNNKKFIAHEKAWL